MLVVVLRHPTVVTAAFERVVDQLEHLPARTGAEVVVLDVRDATHGLTELCRLADHARADGRSMAVVDGRLVIPTSLMEIVLDDPRSTTRALVSQVPAREAGPVLVRSGQVVASGTEVHELPTPSGAFLGIVHLALEHLASAVVAMNRASVLTSVGDWRHLDVPALLLTALVRDGIDVRAVPLEPFPGAVASDDDEVRAVIDSIQRSDEPALRWQRATRTDDGFFSTFVLRRISRRVTPLVHRAGLTPNTVTLLSLVVAAGAAAAFLDGSRPWLVVGALLFLSALVVDCVDGELARYTRNFTATGAWLDAATDRIKEYGVVAALAAGAARHGTDLWTLAAVAMALQVTKHMQDFAFAETVLVARRRPSVDTRSLALVTWSDVDVDADSVGARKDPVERWSARTGRRRAVYWIKRVLHMPIGERWLVLAVGTALSGPRAALLAYSAVVLLALAWTTTGWVLRSLMAHETTPGPVRESLRDLRDDGLLVRRRPLPDAAGVGPSLAWLVPPAITALEAAASIGLAAALAPAALPWAFLWFFATAWRRYDIFYRHRDRGADPGHLAGVAGGGWGPRIVVLVVASLFGADVLAAVLVGGSVWLMAVFTVDAVRAAFGSADDEHAHRPTSATGNRRAAEGPAR